MPPWLTTRPWLDTGLERERRVELLLGELTPHEKVGQLHLAAELDPDRDAEELREGRIGAAIYSSGAHGADLGRAARLARTTSAVQTAAASSRLALPVLVVSDIVHGVADTHPIPLAMAATWDLALIRDCAAEAAGQARALGIHLTLTPMVDISTEHRWGRIGETFGGEPTLTARMGTAAIAGFQAGDRLGATAKHFCGYGLVQPDHDHDTQSIGLNTLHNTQLRPFREAVDAGVRALMVGFHDVDGVPMHCHTGLIRDLVKTEWGFDGLVISDWDGIGQLVHQGVATDLRDAARLALIAGVDLDLASGAYRRHLLDLVDTGDLDPALLDDAVRRVLRLKFALGLFDEPDRPRDGPATAAGPGLARRAAAASMVLLKNSGILPLHRNVGVVHLCGPFVEDARALLGTWVFDAAADALTPAQALAEQLPADQLVVTDGRYSDLSALRSDAADLTVALVGEHPSRSGDDRCLPAADLPVGQLDLLRELAAVGRPLVVVVLAGRPLDLRPVLGLADAVLVAWHPGSEAASALADVLFGTMRPGGRLPVRLPRTTSGLATPKSDPVDAEGGGRRFGRSRDPRFGRYLDALGPSELALGFGLDYTTYAYSAVELSRPTLPLRGGSVRVSVEVANTGARPGREIVQLYIRDLVADVVRPLVELADWQAVELEPGESRRVTFTVTAATFGYWDRDLVHRVDPGDVDVIIGADAAQGSSARLVITG